jgi:CubicO group peptidase (beta-lactamase class C family)
MPGGSRSLPGRPNLRYLRLEAKRRLAAGEFPTLHDAQAGVAREHGQLIADVTATPYADAVNALVLAPLGLRDSSFPAGPADIGPGAVTGYHLTLQGTFDPIPAQIPNLQAAAGLWATGADLVRLGLGWSSLLPESLAHEALTPQAEPGLGGNQAGLGWLLSPRGDIAMHSGGGYDATAYLTIRVRDHRTLVVLTIRMIPVNAIADQLLRSWT